jgi:hypothetical protein
MKATAKRTKLGTDTCAKTLGYPRPFLIVFLIGFAISIERVILPLISPTSFQLFQRIKVNDRLTDVFHDLGPPADSRETANGTDYLFMLSGRPGRPTMFDVPFPDYEIVRARDGKVVSRGAYEEYYNPFGPLWSGLGSTNRN